MAFYKAQQKRKDMTFQEHTKSLKMTITIVLLLSVILLLTTQHWATFVSSLSCALLFSIPVVIMEDQETRNIVLVSSIFKYILFLKEKF